MRLSSPSSLVASVVLAATSIALTGCGLNSATPRSGPSGTGSPAISGSVHGGQQPISGATISLYAAGNTSIGSAPRSMLTTPVVTGPTGGFNITGLYTCLPLEQVYLVATGGNAGAGVNPAISLMTALGPCNTLQANAATTFISINEVTTAASAFALTQYMDGAQALGADTSTTAGRDGLAAAFANVKTLVDTTSGAALQTSTGNGIVPYMTLNALANSLAACVNTTQTNSAAGTPCAQLFGYTTGSGPAPADTLQAAVNLAKNPVRNAASIYNLATPASPFLPTLSSAPATFALTVAHPSDVLTWHNNNARNGAQTAEAVLTPANVNSTSFGKKHTFPVDAYLYAQPLYAGGVGMPDGMVHNLLFAASTHATVYAFDADGNNPGAGYLWKQSLVPAGERFVTGNDYGCNNPPEAGIVGTPVIDRGTQTLYVVVKTISTTGSTFFQRIHAISLLDGVERSDSPQLINPAFAGSGDGSTNNSIPFNSQRELNRSALLLTTTPTGGATLWINFASHCDIGPYHGDVVGYNAADLTQSTASYNTTPNGAEGGIWMGAGGMAADPAGYVYALAGNGTFDVNTGGADYGDSAIKLAAPAPGAATTAMTVADYFTPSNQATLQGRDADLGGAAGILINDSGSGAQLLVANDKNGYIYLLDTAHMGHYQTGTHGIDSKNGDVQDFGGQATIIFCLAYFNNTLYTSSPLKAFTFTPGTSGAPGTFDATNPAGTTNLNGTAPVVSANGTSNALVWTLDGSPMLHAFTAPGLTELYNSGQAAGGRDTPPPFLRFISPIVANGQVYVSGTNAVVVYGLL